MTEWDLNLFLSCKTIIYKQAQWVSKILFSIGENKKNIFKPNAVSVILSLLC